MDKKFIPVWIVSLVIVGAGAFYSGMLFQKSQDKTTTTAASNSGVRTAAAGGGNFQNLTPAQRTQLQQQFGGAGGTGRAGRGGAGLTIGSVLSKDATSLTIKMTDGSTKTIYYSDKTTVTKTADTTISDVAVGSEITANGTANTDGSVSATTIQIRPAVPATTTTTPSGGV